MKARMSRVSAMIIDVSGAMAVKKVCPDAITIFITPPSMDELRKRIINRGANTDEEIEKRMSIAEKEMMEKGGFDFIVENADVQKATNDICELIKSVFKFKGGIA